MDEENVRYTHTHKHTHTHTHTHYSAIKKEEILPFATTGMNLECIMLSEISQTRKTNIGLAKKVRLGFSVRCYDLTCMWNLKKNKTNEKT